MALRLSRCIGSKLHTPGRLMLTKTQGNEERKQINTFQQKQQQQTQSSETEREVQHLAKYAADWWNQKGLMRPLHALNEISKRMSINVKNPLHNYQQKRLQSLSKETEREIQHHAKLASDWWNTKGPLRGLHILNNIRVPFIRDGLVARGNVDPTQLNTVRVLQGQNILEVGCGAGVLTEQLARLSCNVTGIDLGEEVIKVARDHLKTHSAELENRICYKVESIGSHIKNNFEKYDAVVVSEVLEHIDDKPAFLTECVQAIKPGGSIFITTLNKTIPMWIFGILVAEYVLNVIPRNTHHWAKLISPVDVQRILDSLNCQTVLVNGCTYYPWSNTWQWINTTNMSYALQAVKKDC